MYYGHKAELLGLGGLGFALQDSTPPVCRDGGFCFNPLFPWLGRQQICGDASGPISTVCASVFPVPDPWGLVLTFAVPVLFLGLLMRGRRRR